MKINIKNIIKKVFNYSKAKCGRCGSNDAWTTDNNYYCNSCGYNSPYEW